ncbi:MAG: hypothetical protein ACE5M4_08860 [Anaerolineales bacterium]
MAVESAVRAHNAENLNKFLPLAEETSAKINHRLYQAIALRGRGVSHGLAGEKAEAANSLAAALDEFRALDTPWQVGRTLVELGKIEQSRGNVDIAKAHYSQALAAFESLGAVPDAERTSAALESLN